MTAPKVAVHHILMEAAKVGHVARDVEGVDLAPPALKYLGDAGHAFDDNAALAGAVALAQDLLIGPNLDRRERHGAESRPLGRRDVGEAHELGDKWMRGVHWRPQRGWAGARPYSSAAGARALAEDGRMIARRASQTKKTVTDRGSEGARVR